MEAITDPVGARTYSPTEEACRKAPALVCNVASRVVWLRRELAKLKRDKPDEKLSVHQLERFLAKFCEPLPFEADLLSGSIERVNTALEGLNPLPNPDGEINLPSRDEVIRKHVIEAQDRALRLLRP